MVAYNLKSFAHIIFGFNFIYYPYTDNLLSGFNLLLTNTSISVDKYITSVTFLTFIFYKNLSEL